MQLSKKQKNQKQRELEGLRLQSKSEEKAVEAKQDKKLLTFRLEFPPLKK
jgi:hypothetical protein